jgi:glutaredoxin
VKEFLSQNGIVYTERDISTDQAAFDELVGLGVMSTPVVTIDGQVVVGFDRQKLNSLLS